MGTFSLNMFADICCQYRTSAPWSGDLGWRVPASGAMGGNLVLTGRAKDTIVLSSGKKVEPEPIEGACSRSPLIKHMVIVGQDKRELVSASMPLGRDSDLDLDLSGRDPTSKELVHHPRARVTLASVIFCHLGGQVCNLTLQCLCVNCGQGVT